MIDYIDGDDTVWEREPLETLADEGQLAAYRHAASGRTWTRCATRTCSRTMGQGRGPVEDLVTAGRPPRHVRRLLARGDVASS